MFNLLTRERPEYYFFCYLKNVNLAGLNFKKK